MYWSGGVRSSVPPQEGSFPTIISQTLSPSFSVASAVLPLILVSMSVVRFGHHPRHLQHQLVDQQDLVQQHGQKAGAVDVGRWWKISFFSDAEGGSTVTVRR